MKNVLMLLLLVSGVGLTQLSAQSCCTPCPPGCCIKSCSAGKSASAVNTGANATCTPEQMKNCTPEQMKNCTPEQMKACGMSGASGKSCAGYKNAAVTAPTGKSQSAIAEAKPVARKSSGE